MYCFSDISAQIFVQGFMFSKRIMPQPKRHFLRERFSCGRRAWSAPGKDCLRLSPRTAEVLLPAGVLPCPLVPHCPHFRPAPVLPRDNFLEARPTSKFYDWRPTGGHTELNITFQLPPASSDPASIPYAPVPPQLPIRPLLP